MPKIQGGGVKAVWKNSKRKQIFSLDGFPNRCIVNHPSFPSHTATPLPSPQARQEQWGGAEDSRDRPAVQQGGGGVLPGGDDRVAGEVSWGNKVLMSLRV